MDNSEGKGYRVAFWVFLILMIASFVGCGLAVMSYASGVSDTSGGIFDWFFGNVIAGTGYNLGIAAILLIAGIAFLVIALVFNYLGNKDKKK